MLTQRSFVYFIGDRRAHLVKIGHTNDPIARLRTLRVGSSYDLEIIAVFDGTQADEFRLHANFQKWRIRGEWFQFSAEIELFIYQAPLIPIPRLYVELGYEDPTVPAQEQWMRETLSDVLGVAFGKNLTAASRAISAAIDVNPRTARHWCEGTSLPHGFHLCKLAAVSPLVARWLQFASQTLKQAEA